MKKKVIPETQEEKIDEPTQIIYVDKLTKLGFGASTAKLVFSNITSAGENIPSLTLVMPTISLIEALNNLQKSIHEDEENKATLLEQIDVLKEKFSNL